MLELKHVTYTVTEDGNEKQILQDINLTFGDGEIVAITGHNGSGKSTLVKLIMGILHPTSGRIYLDGEDITDLPITDRANRGISYAFQTPVCFKGLTVQDLLDTASHGNNSLDDACGYLSRVGLCARDYIGRTLDDKLSGGELKRIELATALARRAKLNIYDEPEAGIDLWSFGALTDIFDTTAGETIVIISHQEKILQIADKILVLNNTAVEQFGEAKQILKSLQADNSACDKLRRGAK